MEKQELRLQMKQRRKKVENPAEQAEHCLEKLAQLPEFQQAKTLFCYATHGTELPTKSIAAFAVKAGKRVAYPKVTGEGTMVFYADCRLAPGYQGILEPVGGKEVLPAAGDLMLVPGLAFSKEGYRLGYGKGFYDRYLAALKEKPICCGIGYPFQIAQVPHEAHDQKLQLLVTPKETCRF